MYLHDHIRSEISHGRYVGMVTLDVQKAFDSVDHDMLCEKIRLAGIDSEWFMSYLHSRKQVVQVNNNTSTEQIIKTGVPQGSILGPWCYLIYSNDIETSVNCKLLMYADDTVLLVSDSNMETIGNELSREVENCYQWMTNNKLSMHMGKTEVIIFSSKRKKSLVKNFQINCHDSVIKSSDRIKYLGLHLDQNLTGEHTVSSIISKCTSKLKFMYCHSKALNQRARKNLASVLIQCHFDYSASAWYMSVCTTLKNKLQIAQIMVMPCGGGTVP